MVAVLLIRIYANGEEPGGVAAEGLASSHEVRCSDGLGFVLHVSLQPLRAART